MIQYTIRLVEEADLKILQGLFHNTINLINCRDYNVQQVAAWSANRNNGEVWQKRLKDQYFVVAEHESDIVGFASIATDGYLDLMFTHHQWQGKGVASSLLNHITDVAFKRQLPVITTHASITAKPFFQSKGFEVIQQQVVHIKDIGLTNFIMRKHLSIK